MNRQQLTKRTIPDAPGVYFFLGAHKRILYIGKATSLRNRIKSYFAADITQKRSELIEKMITEAVSVEWTATSSVLEALILETNLIRTHKPVYNTRSKDDKSYHHLVITNEEYPRVLVVRGKQLAALDDESGIQYTFGPFPNSQLFREALAIVQKLFKFYDTAHPVGREKSKMARGKIDFNRQIGLYPDTHSKREYTKTIRHIRLFFEGKKGQVVRELERDMHACARREEFEKAAKLKRKIYALTHIEDIALLRRDYSHYRDEKRMRIEAYDVAHTMGGNMVGAMAVLENGEPHKQEYRRFTIQSVTRAHDTAALREILTRRLAHDEWPLPQILVVDGSTAQKRVAERVLHTHELMIPVVAVVKDEHHRPCRIVGERRLVAAHSDAILHANAEAHRFVLAFHRHARRRSLKGGRAQPGARLS